MDNYLGEIRLFAGTYAPEDWHFCDGSTLNISDYQALFALLGTTYGGDGVNTFKLPNLMQKVPIGIGQLAGGSNYVLGNTGGLTTVTLDDTHTPAHSHVMNANNADATTGVPTNAYLAATNGGYPNVKLYMPLPSGTNAPNGTLDTNTVSSAYGAGGGGDLAHNNMMPYMAMYYIIAMVGLYPQAQ